MSYVLRMAYQTYSRTKMHPLYTTPLLCSIPAAGTVNGRCEFGLRGCGQINLGIDNRLSLRTAYREPPRVHVNR